LTASPGRRARKDRPDQKETRAIKGTLALPVRTAKTERLVLLDPKESKVPLGKTGCPALKGFKARKVIRAPREKPARRVQKVTQERQVLLVPKARKVLKVRRVTQALPEQTGRMEHPAPLVRKGNRARRGSPERTPPSTDRTP